MFFACSCDSASFTRAHWQRWLRNVPFLKRILCALFVMTFSKILCCLGAVTVCAETVPISTGRPKVQENVRCAEKDPQRALPLTWLWKTYAKLSWITGVLQRSCVRFTGRGWVCSVCMMNSSCVWFAESHWNTKHTRAVLSVRSLKNVRYRLCWWYLLTLIHFGHILYSDKFPLI